MATEAILFVSGVFVLVLVVVLVTLYQRRRRGGEHPDVADQVPRRPVHGVTAPPRKSAGTRQSRGWWLRRRREK